MTDLRERKDGGDDGEAEGGLRGWEWVVKHGSCEEFMLALLVHVKKMIRMFSWRTRQH